MTVPNSTSVPKELLSDAELSQIDVPANLMVWQERAQGAEHKQIVVAFDCAPLLRLINDASQGCRVYELLSIARPADLLHYLWATLPDNDSPQALEVRERFDDTVKETVFSQPMGEACSLGFLALDKCFYLDIEDTEQTDRDWFAFKQSKPWRAHVSLLFAAVRVAQQRLREIDDALIRFEVEQVALGQHYLDFEPRLERFGDLTGLALPVDDIPADLRKMILSLAAQDNVQSVSVPFQDYALWRGLVNVQRQRLNGSGCAPQDAFRLNGPDSGITWVNSFWYRADLHWGGEVHIPYEGCCGGDVFVFPRGFGLDSKYAKIAPTLSAAVFGPNYWAYEKFCMYFLTKAVGLGEIESAHRKVFGDWVLYTAKDLRPPREMAPRLDEQGKVIG